MKQLKRLSTTAALVLALSVSAFAGHIPIPEPTPQQATSVSVTSAGGSPSGIQDEESASQVIEELALRLFQALLSVY